MNYKMVNFNKLNCTYNIIMSNKKCLIIVDMQYDFVDPKGSLYVKGAELIVPHIKNIVSHFPWDLIIFTQDWHPPDHVSFYTSHPGKKNGQLIRTHYGPQKLWPPHCIQNSHGAMILPSLLVCRPHIIVQKGYLSFIDSYSGFGSRTGQFKTGLDEILKSHNISDVFICGVATDFCVQSTAFDSIKNGYNTFVITDATASITDLHKELLFLEDHNIHLVYFEKSPI